MNDEKISKRALRNRNSEKNEALMTTQNTPDSTPFNPQSDDSTASSLYRKAVKKNTFNGSFKEFLDYYNANKEKVASAVDEGVNLAKSIYGSISDAKSGGHLSYVSKDAVKDGFTELDRNNNQVNTAPKSNTLNYIFIGAGVLVAGFIIYKLATSNKATPTT